MYNEVKRIGQGGVMGVALILVSLLLVGGVGGAGLYH